MVCVLFLIIGLTPTLVIGYKNFADVPCGKTLINSRKPKVVGGQDALPHEFPWLVSITRKGGHYCGGSIINSRFILTAAHCLCSGSNSIPARQFRVTLGEYNLREAEVPAAVTENVRRVTVHPDHICGQYVNDIAILELESPITWSDTVQPACLPVAQGENGYNSYDNEQAIAAGWGWLGEDRSKYKRTDVLQKVEVNVVENKVCRQWYESQGKKTRVEAQQMCAGHEAGGHDSCWADSGGPLMIKNHLQDECTVVVGVVSSGVGCARPRLPGIYTRISEYIPWITQQTLS
ncbi:venom protease-like [Chelonus insularis]|uniref:venom protease-like n=1 Tax=Chelonus insularis TaxID=460826 RepID=UPI00158E60AB|nr:venom protease-like [Chelonus insularis]